MLKKHLFNKLIAGLSCLILLASCEDTEYLQRITAQRNRLTESFNNPAESPLSSEALLHFKGLKFFSIDKNWCIPASLKRNENPQPFAMQHTHNKQFEYVRYGTLHFMYKEQAYTLTVFRSTDTTRNQTLFIPFADKTNGKFTYSGGRYIDLAIPQGNVTEIDFNLAYNPYCAFVPDYACPIIPAENHLDLDITAGEKYSHE